MKPPLAACLLLSVALTGCPSAGEGEHGSPTPAPSASDTPQVAVPEPSQEPPPSPDAPTPGDPSAVGPAPPPRHPRPEDGRPGTDFLRTIELDIGGKVKLQTWVADTPQSRELGLMHVTAMPEDRGMIFVYPRAGRRSFWMRNTKIPLSLAYIAADGTIDQILDMEPMTTQSHPSQSLIRLVLEVNQGWFLRHGVVVGDRIPGLQRLVGH